MFIAEQCAGLEIGQERKMYPLLLWDEESVVLVDTGLPGQAELLREAMAQVGLAPERLTHILLTHQDWDHIGCLRDLAALAPTAQVMCHEDEAPYIQGDLPPYKAALREAAARDETARAEARGSIEAYAQYTLAIDRKLRDGEVLPLCGGIRILHTPGHTPGHMCVFGERDGVLMAGDALNMAEGRPSGPNPVHTAHMAQARRSNRLLADLPAKALLTYHGGVYFGDVPAAIAALEEEK